MEKPKNRVKSSEAEMRFKELKRLDGSTNIDGNYLVLHDDKLLRIIEKSQQVYREAYKFTGNIQNIVPTTLYYEDNDCLVFEHKKINNITYFMDWTSIQRIEAAIKVIEIQKELTAHGFYLKDPHAFNITFLNAKPLYIDYGSIQKGTVIAWRWYLKKFLKIYFYQEIGWAKALSISKIKIYYTAAKVFLNRKGVYEIIICFLSNIIKYKEQRLCTGNNKGPNPFANKAKQVIKYLLPVKGVEIVKNMICNIQQLKSNTHGKTKWTNYCQETAHTSGDSERVKNFIRIIEKHKPHKLVDIGANKGFFSKLALSLGVEEVVAMDCDEYSIDCLRKEIKANNMNMWTVAFDLMTYQEDISHYARYGTFAPLYERVNSDFCICFAVVHHICYFGNYTFENFAERLHKFSRKYLLVEFIPYNDIHLKGPIYEHKDRSWYTQENFIKVMKKYFPGTVELYESTPHPRVLIMFSKQ